MHWDNPEEWDGERGRWERGSGWGTHADVEGREAVMDCVVRAVVGLAEQGDGRGLGPWGCPRPLGS